MIALCIAASAMGAVILAFLLLCLRTRILARKKRCISRCDCIIVLGGRVWPDGRMSNTLTYRCERALEIRSMFPGIKIIPSGGKGGDEPFSEASAMEEYFLRRGVPEKDIILEDKSRSTMENLVFSAKIMQENGLDSAIIVTSDYHAERALSMSRDIGMNACAASAKSPDRIKTKIKTTVQESISWVKYLLLRKNVSVFIQTR